MPKRRRTALALLAATILAPSAAQTARPPPSSNASTLPSTGPGILNTTLFDMDLPECDFTGIDRNVIGGPGLDCYLKSFSQSEGKGTCAPGCCCDTKASSERTVRLVSAAGGCGAMYVTGEDNKVKELIVLPWSVTGIGPGGTCAVTTDTICGRFAPGCLVAPVKRVAKKEDEARAKIEEKRRGGGGEDVQAQADKKVAEEQGISGKEIAAISVSTAVIMLIFGFVIVRFILLPWFRGELNDSECSQIM